MASYELKYRVGNLIGYLQRPFNATLVDLKTQAELAILRERVRLSNNKNVVTLLDKLISTLDTNQESVIKTAFDNVINLLEPSSVTSPITTVTNTNTTISSPTPATYANSHMNTHVHTHGHLHRTNAHSYNNTNGSITRCDVHLGIGIPLPVPYVQQQTAYGIDPFGRTYLIKYPYQQPKIAFQFTGNSPMAMHGIGSGFGPDEVYFENGRITQRWGNFLMNSIN
jgi:hypothetical protein